MPYVQRDEHNRIVAIFACLQPGVAEEFVENAAPVPPIPDKAAVLAQFRTLREQVLNRLTGLYIDAKEAGDTTACEALIAARQGLRAIPQHASVVGAADGLATKQAIQVLYDKFGDDLRTASPSSYVAFVGMGPV